jgi:hypothetical protein
MSNKTRIALLLAIAIAPASAMAATKHPVRHQVGPAVERQAPGDAYARDRQAPSAAEPTYMWIQDRGFGTGE